MTDRSRPDDEGAVGIFAAMSLAMLLGFGAIAIDTSYLYFGKRNLQAAVDAAALSAAQSPTNAQALANATFLRQGLTDVVPVTTAGVYDDLAATQSARFAPPSGTAPLSAVRVVADRTVPLGLSRILTGRSTTVLHASAVAANVPAAAFTLSSTTATLNGGVLNSLLSALLGGSISLSAASYQSLLNTNVSLLKTLDQLALNIGAQAGTYDGLADTNASVGSVLTAAADVLNAGSTANPAGSALLSLAAKVNPNLSLRLGDLLSLGLMKGAATGASGQGSAYADLGLSALQLVQTSAALGGTNAVTVNNLITLPGLAQVSASLAAIEPPATAPAPPAAGLMVLGPVGSQAQTAQVRLQLSAKVLGGLSLGILGNFLLSSELPILIQVAPAKVTLTSVDCSAGPANVSIGVLAETGVVTAAIGSVTNAALADPSATTLQPQPAQLLSALGGLLKITVSTPTPVTLGKGSGTLNFSTAQINNHTPQSINSTNQVSGLLSALAGSGHLQVNVELLTLIKIPIGDIVSAVTNLISPVLAGLDPLLNGLLETVGVKVGVAEVTPGGARCGVPVLVM